MTYAQQRLAAGSKYIGAVAWPPRALLCGVMTTRTTPPFRADHVGSLLRPPSVLQARADHASGTITAAQLRAVEYAAIRDIVSMQEDLGLRSATDGEFRRTSWP